ncbi:hypothetical protein MKK58_23550 [Methylobacterium sp. J-078]|uniref:hypothetical protein n=1 Tax=Methylobacterium sp. J-078 TaxID=2836657 RepID=UPI001FB92F85|nr:hypothetical protein [Methylobacterium sp. J-078]MCJ2047492.1 hypothetical protein [Methylobacterium sp. J-078]
MRRPSNAVDVKFLEAASFEAAPCLPPHAPSPDRDRPPPGAEAAWRRSQVEGRRSQAAPEGFATRMFAAARADDGAASGRGISLGWKTSLFVNLVVLVVPSGLVVALPPVLECRARAERFGFFAGETLNACAERGIRVRVKRLDDRLKMLVRGSGP